MEIKNLTFISLILSILVISAVCQKQSSEWKGTIDEVDGVTVVKNPKEPRRGK